MSKTKMEIRSNIINDPDNAVAAFIQLQVEFLELQQKLEEKEREVEALKDKIVTQGFTLDMAADHVDELKAENERLRDTLELAHEHMELYLPHYRSGNSVRSEVEASLQKEKE